MDNNSNNSYVQNNFLLVIPNTMGMPLQSGLGIPIQNSNLLFQGNISGIPTSNYIGAPDQINTSVPVPNVVTVQTPVFLPNNFVLPPIQPVRNRLILPKQSTVDINKENYSRESTPLFDINNIEIAVEKNSSGLGGEKFFANTINSPATCKVEVNSEPPDTDNNHDFTLYTPTECTQPKTFPYVPIKIKEDINIKEEQIYKEETNMETATWKPQNEIFPHVPVQVKEDINIKEETNMETATWKLQNNEIFPHVPVQVKEDINIKEETNMETVTWKPQNENCIDVKDESKAEIDIKEESFEETSLISEPSSGFNSFENSLRPYSLRDWSNLKDEKEEISIKEEDFEETFQLDGQSSDFGTFENISGTDLDKRIEEAKRVEEMPQNLESSLSEDCEKKTIEREEEKEVEEERLTEMLDNKQRNLSLRGKIVGLFEAGMAKNQIARKLRISVKTVKKWVERHKVSGDLRDLPRSGCPRRTTPNLDQKIIQFATDNPLTNAREIQRRIQMETEIDVSDTTIRRRIHIGMGYEEGVDGCLPDKGGPRNTTQQPDEEIVQFAERNPCINSCEIWKRSNIGRITRTACRRLREAGIYFHVHAARGKLNENRKAERSAFANENREKSIEFWSRVVFADEKTFTYSNGKLQCWHLNSPTISDDLDEPNHEQVKCDVWGWVNFFTHGEVTPLNGMFTTEQYIQILDEVFLPSVRNLFPHPEKFFYVQNNSRIHRAKIVQQWFEERRDFIEVLKWPSRGCDLNAMENVWASMVKDWDAQEDNTKEVLERQVLKSWENARRKHTVVENFITSIPSRLKVVAENQGDWIIY